MFRENQKCIGCTVDRKEDPCDKIDALAMMTRRGHSYKRHTAAVMVKAGVRPRSETVAHGAH